MNRWRNYGLWTAIASLILLVLQRFGLEVDVGWYDDLVTGILSVLVLAGVISNPMNGRGFTDKPHDYEGQ
ncbi:holin [Aneurinibacillus aneurinilyticus]|uniref:Holin n=1 Tax=Aneurinibacillus aneurinilyticus TaxID=1391 RepID=A0A848CZJ7_ANEAE|nr:holin [Aneurinibacillus aneurinilyticus]NMF01154.1 holin [Aneurinibacillus aneurinilyticus]